MGPDDLRRGLGIVARDRIDDLVVVCSGSESRHFF